MDDQLKESWVAHFILFHYGACTFLKRITLYVDLIVLFRGGVRLRRLLRKKEQFKLCTHTIPLRRPTEWAV